MAILIPLIRIITGTDAFNYTVTDGTTNVTASVYLTIDNVNDAPSADTVYRELANDIGTESVIINSLNSAYDIDGDSLYLDSIVTEPAYGTVTLNADGTLTYTRTSVSPLSNGQDSFIIKIRDRLEATGDVLTHDQRIVIGVDFVPTLYSDSVWVNVDEDSPAFWINLTYSNPNNADLTIEVADSTLGTIIETDTVNHRVLFEQTANAYGSETLNYTITDATSSPVTSTTSQIYLSINSINDAPVFTSIISDQTIQEDTNSIWLTTTFEDADSSGSLIFTYYIDEDNDHPVILREGIDIQRIGNMVLLRLTPIANAYGEANIIMQVSDGLDITTTSFYLTVDSVNDAPTTVDYNINLPEDSFMNFEVITPNSDVDGDDLSVSIVEAPIHGIAIVNADQTITYTPETNYHGFDVLTYQLSDGNGGNTNAYVYLTIDSVNDLPQISSLKQNYSVIEDHDLSITFNISDVDLNIIDVTLSYEASALFEADAITVTQVGENWVITVHPQGDGFGSQLLTVHVSDGTSEVTQNVELTVLPENDLPIAQNDAYSVNEDEQLILDVLNNDRDIEDTNLKVVEVSATESGAKLSVNADGTITYQPLADYYGEDSFTYTISDTANGKASATVSVNVLSVNDQPVAKADNYSINEDDSVNMAVLANDNDIENDPLTIIEAGSDATLAESITINADGTLTYIPKLNEYGTDVFTYTISDGQSENATTSATVTVVIAPRQ